MNMQGVKARAKMLGVKSGKMRKADLIRTIQTTEGNLACFQTGREICDQSDCCWREDCLAN